MAHTIDKLQSQLSHLWQVVRAKRKGRDLSLASSVITQQSRGKAGSPMLRGKFTCNTPHPGSVLLFYPGEVQGLLLSHSDDIEVSSPAHCDKEQEGVFLPHPCYYTENK